MTSYMIYKATQVKRIYAKSNTSSMKPRNGERNTGYNSKYSSTYWCTILVTEEWRQRRQSQSTGSRLNHQMKPNTWGSSLIKNYDSSRTCSILSKKVLMQQ